MVSRPSGPVVLHYFGVYLRGEVIRMLLAHLSIQYTDDRINPPDWPRLKMSGKYEFQQMPMLEYEGKCMAQKASILRYVCQRNNMYPQRSNLKDIYLVESVCDLIGDLTNPLYSLFFLKDMQGVENFFRDKVPGFLQMTEKRLQKNQGGRGFFVGNSCTMADIVVFNAIWDLFLRPEVRARNESKVPPTLKAFSDRMLAGSQGLKNYVNTRVTSPV